MEITNEVYCFQNLPNEYTGITVLLGSSDKKSNCLWLYWGKVHRLPLELQSGGLKYSIGGHICQF